MTSSLAPDAFPLRHAQTHNLAFLVTQGNKKWIHLGDADPSPDNFEALRNHPRPDVALVPFWWLTNENGRDFLFNTWKPGHIKPGETRTF
ncbi:MAG: hypothetical protein SGI92_15075 [Bryobacteraceae bacterium]|nr:hypothetical protein [Bryobacteraceae bacterium]